MFNFFKSKKIQKLEEENKQLKAQLLDIQEKQSQVSLKNIFPFETISHRIQNQPNHEIESYIELLLNNKKDENGEVLNKLIANIFELHGYTVEIRDGLKDRKVDIAVFDTNNNPLYGIQCKSHTVSDKYNELPLTGIIAENTFTIKSQQFQPIFITTSYIDSSVIKNGYEEELTLIDRIGVIELLNKYFPRETANVFNKYLLNYLDTFDKKGNLIQSKNCTVCSNGKLYMIKYTKNVKYRCSNCYRLHNLKNGEFTPQRQEILN